MTRFEAALAQAHAQVQSVERLIAAAEHAGITIDRGNVVDLILDNIDSLDIEGAHIALRASAYAGRLA